MSSQEIDVDEAKERFLQFTQSTSTNADPNYFNYYRNEYLEDVRRTMDAERDRLFRKYGSTIRYREYEPPRYKAYQPEEEIKYVEPKEFEIKIEDYVDRLYTNINIEKSVLRGYIGGDEPPKTKEEEPAPVVSEKEFIFDPEDLDI